MAESITILFPPGRLIMGDCYRGSDKDSKGQPRTVKKGPNAGQPLTQFFLGVAIPKAGERAWWETAWGQQCMQVGQQAFPTFFQNPAFAWKIEDGDSTVPNKNNRRPCDAEGAKGHWILKFTSGFAPKLFAQPSPGVFQELTQPGLIKTGYWVQVFGNVAGNNSAESPGIYLNFEKVLFVRQDAEITSGTDAATAFAGAAVSAQLPTGVTAVPFAGATPGVHPGMAPMPAAMPAMPGAAPAVPAMPAMPGAAPAVPAAVAVAPHPGILAVAPPAVPATPMAPPAVPVAPAAPAASAVPQMTPAGLATGFTYQQFRQQGWTDEQLRANGTIY